MASKHQLPQDNNNKATQIAVDNLSWSIENNSILTDISFAVHKGSFTGLIGPNGAGKSSLLRCLYRYLKPTKGHVEFNRTNIWHYSASDYAKHVAVVLQESPSHFNLTVREVVALGLLPHQSLFGSVLSEDKVKIDSALIQVGLVDKQGDAFNHLSGGEKQRVLIARAIVQSPSLLIMDEPTSHLDIKYQIQIMELAKSLGITVIASFHDLNLASAMCDRLLVLDQGRLVADGEPEQVLTSDLISKVFGVCTEVTRHPQHGRPQLTYYYGYAQTGIAGTTGVTNSSKDSVDE